MAEFAGIVLPLLGGSSPDPKVTDTPLLIIHGDKDGTVAYDQGVETFKKVKVPRWFITLPGANPHPAVPDGSDQPRNRRWWSMPPSTSSTPRSRATTTGSIAWRPSWTDSGAKVATIESAG